MRDDIYISELAKVQPEEDPLCEAFHLLEAHVHDIQSAMDTRPNARRTDPRSSRMTYDEITAEGIRGKQAKRVYLALCDHEGRVKSRKGVTSKDLAEEYDLDRYMVARRLPDLERAGFVEKLTDPFTGNEVITRNKSGNRPACLWRTVQNGE
jgi:hypothetical protein